MTSTDDLLGTGWAFPPAPGPGGQGIALVSGDENIRQAIWVILGTARGERLMRPDFGCGIHDLVFAVNDATTSGLAAEEVRQALAQFEPRIDVLSVAVAPQPGQPSTLLVTVGYRVRSTNLVTDLTYPFSLEESVT